MVLAKEILVVCAPVVVMVAFGRWAPRDAEWRRRSLGLLGASGSAVVLALLPTLVVLSGLPADGYAREYGEGAMGLSRLRANARLMAYPLSRVRPELGNLAALPLLAVLLAAAPPALADRASRRTTMAVLAVAASLIAAGALVYLPWPRIESFYGLPFQLGTVLVLAAALTTLGHSRSTQRLAVAAIMLTLALGALDSRRRTEIAATRRRVDASVARLFGDHPGHDSLLVAQPGGVTPRQRWQGTGPTLRRYAVAVGVATASSPAVADVACTHGADHARRRRAGSIVIWDPVFCADMPAPTRVLEERGAYLDPLSLETRTADQDVHVYIAPPEPRPR
jgi:hypothetical protein